MFTLSPPRRWPVRLRHAALALAAVAALIAGGLVSTSPADAATAQLKVGQKAHFHYFDVTVEKAVMEPEYYGYLIKLKVCVNHLPPGSSGGKTRISWDPWTIGTNHGTRHPSVQEDPPVPTFPLDYQSEGQFAVGECATGWLPFWDLKLNDKITTINYKNTLGDKAKWAPSKTLLTLGQTKTFKYFTVRVTHVQAEEFWFGVRAKVCVRRLPPGSTGHKTRVSWDPWSLSTDHGTIPMAIAQEGTSPWSNVFPESIRLRKGECVSGWLPFAAHDDVAVSKVKYHNTLGNKIAWIV